MTWAVFYRPPPEHEAVIRRSDTTTPRFKVPLSRAILNDPAFSPDPRSHPHFPLANAASYKALPSKSPRISHPQSLPSEPLFSSTSTPSSAISPSQSPTYSPSPLSPLSPSNSVSPPSTQLKRPRRRHSLPVPEILPRLDSTNALASDNLKPVALQNTRIPRKGRMKALVRRLTSLHNLDRIDELDETDPSGVNYHHDGPYEAIGSNIAHPSLPQRYRDTVPPGANTHHSKQRELHPGLFRPGQHRSAFRMPSTHDDTGLSLNLEPGQILQQNSIYNSHASSIVSVPSQFHPQPNTTTILTRPDHSRSSSLSNTRTRSPDDSSLESLDGFQNRPPLSLHPPRERYFGDNMPNIPNTLPLHRDRDVASCVPRQTETTVFPPPRYESSFQSSVPPRSPQYIPQPPFNAMSRKTQPTENVAPALSPHSPRHKSIHSLDSSYQLNSTITQSTSSIHDKPLEPPRIRHLPKRLVMPAPLQPQPQQLQRKSPPAEAAAWQDGYPDDHALEGAHFDGPPAMYTQNSRLLRKRSSAFPAKTPIPDHGYMFQDDPAPIMGDSPTKVMNEAEGTKERTRRRRLSKRKNDI